MPRNHRRVRRVLWLAAAALAVILPLVSAPVTSARPGNALALTDGSVADSTVAPVPFGPGEELVFSIDYGPVNAGEATLEILGVVDFQGRRC